MTAIEDVSSGRSQILAPAGFLEEAVSENVIAGPAMIRRAMSMYGPLGSVGLIPPTEEIHER